MSIDIWFGIVTIILTIVSILLAIPQTIAAVSSPKVQSWLESIHKEKSFNKPQHEEPKIWKDENKKESQQDIEKIKDRLIYAGVLYAPFILIIIASGSLIKNSAFLSLVFLSFIPSIHLFMRFTQRFIRFLKHKRENKNDMQEEIEKIKNLSITIGIIYLPIVVISLGEPNNNTWTLLFFLSLCISVYFIIHSIILYIKLSNNKSKLDLT